MKVKYFLLPETSCRRHIVVFVNYVFTVDEMLKHTN